MKIENPKTLLSSDWRKLYLKGKNKTVYKAKNVIFKDDKEKSKTIIDLYDYFIKNGSYDSWALVKSLIIKFGIIGVRISGKTLSFELGDERIVKAKLTINDIIDNYEDFINMIISSFKSNRALILKKVIEDNKDIFISCDSRYESSIRKTNNEYVLKLINERGNAFNLNDHKFLKDLIEELINAEEEKVVLNEETVNMTSNNLAMDGYGQKVTTGLEIMLPSKRIYIDVASIDIIQTIKNIIEEHNNTIEELNNGTTYVKKDKRKEDNNE